MAAEAQRQRFSFWGGVTLVVVAVVVYICVSEGRLLILYWLATLTLITLMMAVLFDFGVRGSPAASPDEANVEAAPEPAPAAVSSAPAAPPRRRRKKRKRRR